MLSKRGKKGRAATPMTAPNNDQLSESYRNSASASSGKFEEIANLLLILAGDNLPDAQRLSWWLLFERQLSLYYRGKTT